MKWSTCHAEPLMTKQVNATGDRLRTRKRGWIDEPWGPWFYEKTEPYKPDPEDRLQPVRDAMLRVEQSIIEDGANAILEWMRTGKLP